MTLYDLNDLDEAMNAIKEEIIKDLSESVVNETSNNEVEYSADTNSVALYENAKSNNMVIFLISPPKCMYPKEFTDIFSCY